MNGPDFIQNIPLDKLVKSPRNVRRTPPSETAEASGFEDFVILAGSFFSAAAGLSIVYVTTRMPQRASTQAAALRGLPR